MAILGGICKGGCGQFLVGDKDEIAVSGTMMSRDSGKMAGAYFKPRDCRLRPARRETGVSFPRGWFEMEIDAGSTFLLAVWMICREGQMERGVDGTAHLVGEETDIVSGCEIEAKVAVL